MKKVECDRTEFVRGDRLALSLSWKNGGIAAVQVYWVGEVDESDDPTPQAVELKAALVRYESREAPQWPELPLELTSLTDFQRAALDELLRIQPGTTRTYGEMATLLDRPGGAQAVGRAMATNPFPLIYPCHRVVGADGALTGFSGSGGVDMKEYLLRLEGALPAEQAGLF